MLGVVENMSGLRQAATEVAFKQSDGKGGEADVTARVLQILREQLGDQVGILAVLFISRIQKLSSMF